MQDEGEVVGWGRAGAPWARADGRSVSRWIVEVLRRVGVRDAFGVLGGGIAPFAAGLSLGELRFRSFRHEAGAGFAAIEAFHATRRPVAVVATTGPGLANVMNAAMAARLDGAKLILVSGLTSRAQRGRGAVQETSTSTMPADWLRSGPIFHLAATPESVPEVQAFLQRVQVGLSRPGGFVAHLALPWSLQAELVDHEPRLPAWRVERGEPSAAGVDVALEALRDDHALLWVGHGAVDAADGIRRLVEVAHLPVVASPRAKGVLPERHPLYVGVSGAGGTASVLRFFRRRRPRTPLVLGTRLGEVTSFLSPELVPSASWVHVDVDDDAFGAAFPGTPGTGIVADSRAFVAALLARAAETNAFAARAGLQGTIRAAVAEVQAGDEAPEEGGGEEGGGPARPADGVHPRALMRAVQRRVVDGSDAIVMSEAGTSFTWCNACLRFSEPRRYRTSAAWGSMGHFTAGAVGAALAAGRKVVALVGDGAMLMNDEINTAVQYRAPVVWIVLNDAQLGLNEHGMRALGMRPVETQLPRVDFVAFARSQGAAGVAVDDEGGLAAALEAAMQSERPFVVDVRVDRAVPSPVVADRIRSLRAQGNHHG